MAGRHISVVIVQGTCDLCVTYLDHIQIDTGKWISRWNMQEELDYCVAFALVARQTVRDAFPSANLHDHFELWYFPQYKVVFFYVVTMPSRLKNCISMRFKPPSRWRYVPCRLQCLGLDLAFPDRGKRRPVVVCTISIQSYRRKNRGPNQLAINFCPIKIMACQKFESSIGSLLKNQHTNIYG